MNDTVTIESLAYGGAGFGRYGGKACFVPFTAPGDRVGIRVVREKQSFIEASVARLDEPSPCRVPPPCPVFGECGGCSWQHLNYQAQLEAKRAIVSDMLWRFGRVDPSCIDCIVPSPAEYGYRSRVQFKVRSLPGGVQIGFYRQGSHRVVPVPDECRIAMPVINGIFRLLQPLVASLADSDRVPQIDVSAGESAGLIVIVHYLGERYAELADRLQELQCEETVTGIFVQQGRKDTLTKVYGEDRLSYRIPAGTTPSEELELSFSRGGFSQVNYPQNRQLVRTVSEFAALSGEERVLDLYCGNGNFSLQLSQNASSLLGVESFGQSLEDARFNARRAKADNVDFVCGEAGTVVSDLAAAGSSFDCVVLDPPRTGAKDALDGIIALSPERIVYVSCDPATLSRDAGVLTRRGYHVSACRIHDMFPHTYHVETVMLLERRS